MNANNILAMVDHTLLTQDATWEQIRILCDEGIHFKTASVCIPPAFVSSACDYVSHRIKVCTVIGFPNGYATTNTKVFETKDAITNGADEIDMVINISNIKSGKYIKQLDEIKHIREACYGKILKVIIETCLLSDYEKEKMCEIVTLSGADFIKTSTGFAGGGASFKDIKLFKNRIGNRIQIKASGGISTFEDAEKFIELGATRLGTSKLVNLCKNKIN